MSNASRQANEQQAEQCEALPTECWKTFFDNVSWTYPSQQTTPSRPHYKRTPLLRLSRANHSLKLRLSQYLSGNQSPCSSCEDLSGDLVGAKAVEEVVGSYEMDTGFFMIESVLYAMSVGWIPPCRLSYRTDQELASRGRQWDIDVKAMFGDEFKRVPVGKLSGPQLSSEEAEERLKNLSPIWDSCLSDASVIDLVRSAEATDLTDSELSAESDPLPVTPKAGKYSLAGFSPNSTKPLSAKASSFVPSPAKFERVRSPPSSSPSPSPSPPVFDLISFPTLKQTILAPSRKEDHDPKAGKWPAKRSNAGVPSFLTDKSDSNSRKSKTRQLVDKMRSASDSRKPADLDFITMGDDRAPQQPKCKTIHEESHLHPKNQKKRPRRGRESISTVSTDTSSIRSSSVDTSSSNSQPYSHLPSSRSPPATRPPSRPPKRVSISNVMPPMHHPPPTPAFSSPTGSVSSFGGPITPASYPVQFPPLGPPPFVQGGGRGPVFPPPFPYAYTAGGTVGGMLPPHHMQYGGSYQPQLIPYNNYGKNVITGASGIRHASW